MSLVDTHCHLEAQQFGNEPAADVLARAKAAGVAKAITIGTDLATSRAASELAQEHDNLFAAVGVDPKHLGDYNGATLDELEDLAALPEVVAIGEIGLDYHWDTYPRREQKNTFRAQLDLAERLGMPVVIHNRKADADTADVLLAWSSRARTGDHLVGVLHCYSGDLVLAEELFDAGFLISISGIVTYANASDTHNVAAGLPDEALVLETDSPYLTPKSKGRGRNEPAFVKSVAERVAELRSTDLASVARFTSRNAGRLFRWTSS